MKLKLDENLPHDLAAALATRGHDVHTVIDEHLAGRSDPVVVRASTALLSTAGGTTIDRRT